MNSVKNANAMYRHVSNGTATPLFSNYTDAVHTDLRDDPHTIIVHSRMEDGEAATGETGRQIRDLVLQLQICGERFQAAFVMAEPGYCLVPPSPPGPQQH